jgi:hypothetical protein
MNNKILIGIAVTAIIAAIIFNRFSKGKLNNIFEGIKNPSGIPINENGITSPSPKPAINFSQTGNLSKKDNDWYLVNEETTIKLQFNKDSVCDFDKGGQCDLSTFIEGERVKVEGVKTDDAVLVIGITSVS